MPLRKSHCDRPNGHIHRPFSQLTLTRASLHCVLSSPRTRAQLFDEGTLNKRNTKRFDAYNLKEEGEGSVRKTKRKEDTYCGKLQSVKFVGMNGEFGDENNGVFEMESRRALRGNI